MPYDNVPESQWDAMDRCKEKVMAQGHDEKSAIAICYSSIVEGKSFDDAIREFQLEKAAESLKVGARHNRSDNEALQDIHDAAITLGASCPDPTKWPQPKALIFDGAEVKALGNGRVGGYLIRYSTDASPDLEGDYFTKDTDFGSHDEVPLYYQHGLDDKVGKRKIGAGRIKPDDIGQWIEAQLNLRDEYEKYIYQLAEQGKLGWSSGTASHLVEREQKGKAYWIRAWPLGLDASLTPTPAEPRNSVIPIKSLPLEVEAEDMANVAETASVKSNDLETPISGQGESSMEQEELIKLLDERDAVKAKAAEEQAKREAELKAAEEAGFKKAMEELKKVNRGGYTYHKVSGGQEKSEGDDNEEIKSFLHWIRTGDEVPFKAAMQEGNDAEGGYYVPKEYASRIIAKRNELSVPAQIGVSRFTTGSDLFNIPVEGTAATKFVVANEEASYDENEPTAGNAPVTIHKLTKLIKLSEELEEDAVSDFSGYLAGVWGRAMAAADNYYQVASGTGGGEPMSMVLGGALLATSAGATAITAAEFITALFAYPDVYADGAVIICKRDVLGYLRGLLVATPYAFIPQNSSEVGSGNAKSHGSIFGFPVYCTAALTGLTTGAPVASTKHILVVNPAFYGVVERSGLSVSRNPFLYQATGQIGLFAKYRQGATVLQSEAVTYFQQKA